MAVSNTFLYKPQSDSDGNLAVVVPNSFSGRVAQVELVDANGKVVDVGRYTGSGNGGRGTYRFTKPGAAYGGGFTVRTSFDDGTDPIEVGIKSGNARYEQDFSSLSTPGAEGSGINYGKTPGGNTYVIPSSEDFSTLESPKIDFGAALSSAKDLARENAFAYFNNLTSEETRKAAMDLVKADVEGIRMSAEQLSPLVRAQGALDTVENIKRAGSIDTFNFGRIPEFNEFNRSEHEKAVESSGLDFRKRIGAVISQLDAQAKGKFTSELDEALTAQLKNEGSDLLASSGITGVSGAGTRAIDRLQVKERLGMAERAQSLLPSVLTQAQGVLAAPEILAQPTVVPLNTSNIADRLPVTANVSAAQAIENTALNRTKLGTIDASAALNADLATQRFNETGRYETDLYQLEAAQGIRNAQENAAQNSLNAEEAKRQREAAEDAAIRGTIIGSVGSAITGVVPTLLGGNTGQGVGGTQYGGTPQVGLPSFGQGNVSGIPGVLSLASSPQPVSMGNQSYDGGVMSGLIQAASNLFSGSSQSSSTPNAALFNFTSGAGAVPRSNVSRLSTPLGNVNLDNQVVMSAGDAVVNWGGYATPQRLESAGNLGVSVALDKGIITPEESGDIQQGVNTLSVLSNPTASAAQKAAAIAAAGVTTTTNSFTGTINNPITIGGNRVIRTEVLPGGGKGFVTVTPEGVATTVPQAELGLGNKSLAALQAFSVLTSGADTKTKLAALTAVGVQSGTAHELISQVQGGNTMAALSLFATATNWNSMSSLQKAAALMQTSGSVVNAANIATQAGGQGASALAFAPSRAATTTLGSVGNALAGAAAVAGIGLGIKQAADVLSAIDDMPRQKAVKEGVKGGAMSGAAIGAGVAAANAIVTGATLGSVVPVVGTAIGAAIGAVVGGLAGFTGTGKGAAQLARDSWRSSLIDSGLATKNQAGHPEVVLADGTSVDLDNGGKPLVNVGVNVDGKQQRRNYDLDWSNPLAVSAIPNGHVYALATGLDPTNSSAHDLFNKAVNMSINAATTNAKDSAQVTANFKSMLGDKVDPITLGFKVEVLRNMNLINDDEYATYINSINQTLGSKLLATDKAASTQRLIGMLQAKGSELADSEKKLLETLTDDKVLAKNKTKLDKRTGASSQVVEAAVVTPDSATVVEEQPMNVGRNKDRRASKFSKAARALEESANA